MITFWKMHGLGNDFVVINAIEHKTSIKKDIIKQLSDRHCGIGFDQSLVITKSNVADFGCEITNADGSIAEQCGNGMRCVARFLHENKITNKNEFSIETLAGIVNVSIKDYDHITVEMGKPTWDVAPKTIALPNFLANPQMQQLDYFYVSMGNPHAIIFTDQLANLPVDSLGHFIAMHSDFPNGVNAGVVQVKSPNHIELTTYERGVGLTYACGSNACAAVVAGIINKNLDSSVRVELAKGSLYVNWDPKDSVRLTGPAMKVYQGELDLQL